VQNHLENSSHLTQPSANFSVNNFRIFNRNNSLFRFCRDYFWVSQFLSCICYAYAWLSCEQLVHLSITYWYWVKTNEHRIMWFKLSGSPGTLAFCDQISYPRLQGKPRMRASNEIGWVKIEKKNKFWSNKLLHLGNHIRHAYIYNRKLIGSRIGFRLVSILISFNDPKCTTLPYITFLELSV